MSYCKCSNYLQNCPCPENMHVAGLLQLLLSDRQRSMGYAACARPSLPNRRCDLQTKKSGLLFQEIFPDQSSPLPAVEKMFWTACQMLSIHPKRPRNTEVWELSICASAT